MRTTPAGTVQSRRRNHDQEENSQDHEFTKAGEHVSRAQEAQNSEPEDEDDEMLDAEGTAVDHAFHVADGLDARQDQHCGSADNESDDEMLDPGGDPPQPTFKSQPYFPRQQPGSHYRQHEPPTPPASTSKRPRFSSHPESSPNQNSHGTGHAAIPGRPSTPSRNGQPSTEAAAPWSPTLARRSRPKSPASAQHQSATPAPQFKPRPSFGAPAAASSVMSNARIDATPARDRSSTPIHAATYNTTSTSAQSYTRTNEPTFRAPPTPSAFHIPPLSHSLHQQSQTQALSQRPHSRFILPQATHPQASTHPQHAEVTAAFSPHHRKSSRFVADGWASCVRGWVLDAGAKLNMPLLSGVRDELEGGVAQDERERSSRGGRTRSAGSGASDGGSARQELSARVERVLSSSQKPGEDIPTADKASDAPITGDHNRSGSSSGSAVTILRCTHHLGTSSASPTAHTSKSANINVLLVGNGNMNGNGSSLSGRGSGSEPRLGVGSVIALSAPAWELPLPLPLPLTLCDGGGGSSGGARHADRQEEGTEKGEEKWLVCARWRLCS